MNLDIRWNLLTDSSANFGNHLVNAAGTLSRAITRRRDRSAVRNYLQNPADADAFGDLVERDPAMAVRLREDQRERDARTAHANYLLRPGASAGPTPGFGAAPDDPAFAAFARADPEAAAQARYREAQTGREQAASARERVRQARELNNFAMQLLGGVRDQATYDAARAQVRARMVGLGADPSEIDAFPPTYSPDLINSLRMQGMDTESQIERLVADRRLQWDITDDEYDNDLAERALRMRGTLTMRGQDLASRDRRRGQDQTDARTRRGQDLSDARGRRGQDLTDSRGRRGQDLRASGAGRRPGRAGDGAVIVNPTTGQRMRLQGGRWVPAS